MTNTESFEMARVPGHDASDIAELPLTTMLQRAAALRDAGHGRVQSYSRKVFIPLTQLCRNLCHYCTFSQPPRSGTPAFLDREDVLRIAREGAVAGCTEALFTLGDKPEARFPAARNALDALGHGSTISYLAEMCALVRDEVGLLPHVNAGVMTRDELVQLRSVSASMGLMLESVSDRLCEKGGPHYRSPDKLPSVRLETLRLAGELAIPFTTGILIGIGETRAERIAALEAIRDIHREFGHIQEVIVQNFRAKPRTVMANAPEPDLDELLWSIAAARLILGPLMNIQAPPNLSSEDFSRLMDAGINDWGGVSPVTPDHVNPERPWPEIDRLEAVTRDAGRDLVARLPLYPAYVENEALWLAPEMRRAVARAGDATGWARADKWSPGVALPDTSIGTPLARGRPDAAILRSIDRALAGELLAEDEIAHMFTARGIDEQLLCDSADALRRTVVGDAVTYVVNRNINYTNICGYRCGFCAFSKGSTSEALRGTPYVLDRGEVVRRVREAWDRGATEVCLQGGIHPHYSGDTYLNLTRAVREAVPEMHIHAFSPLEIWQGAATLRLPLRDYLVLLKEAGLGTLPGTAAEILDDEVREIICPDKLNSAQWCEVMETAHEVGFRTTATIMFGHVDRPRHWARHLTRIRDIQVRTGGFTEFVPLPFVHMEAPMSLRGVTRCGPTFREVRLMHAIARLALHPHIGSIQTSWVKLGDNGVSACLAAGANDLGGTLMNESISRAAGTQHGQEMSPGRMEDLIRSIDRHPQQRTTTYGSVRPEDRQRAREAPCLSEMIQTPPPRRGSHAKKTEIIDYA